MSLNDYLKCPGVDNALYSIPVEYRCSRCQSTMEIWTDEKKGRCPGCGRVMKKNTFTGKNQDLVYSTKTISDAQVRFLMEKALESGASDVKKINSTDIIVEEDLSFLCGNDPKCENFGLSLSCPPHVAGPSEFRKWQEKSDCAIVIKIDMPVEIMFSPQRREVARLLHQIVAGLEQEAAGMGFIGTRAFAGGSCKMLFCMDKDNCRVLSKRGKCRHPEAARPSMSGFGISVRELMQSAGWSAKSESKTSSRDAVSWLAGLVLIAGL